MTCEACAVTLRCRCCHMALVGEARTWVWVTKVLRMLRRGGADFVVERGESPERGGGQGVAETAPRPLGGLDDEVVRTDVDENHGSPTAHGRMPLFDCGERCRGGASVALFIVPMALPMLRSPHSA